MQEETADGTDSIYPLSLKIPSPGLKERPGLGVLLGGFLLWYFGSLFARFGQADGNGLFSALDLAAFSALAGL
jgi:hypothetical protein